MPERKRFFSIDVFPKNHFPESLCSTFFYSRNKYYKSGPSFSDVTLLTKGGQLDPPFGHVTFFNQRRSVGSPCWSSTELSAGGAKRDVENTPKLYPGPMIQRLGLVGRRTALA